MFLSYGEIYNISVMYVNCNANRLQEYVRWLDWNTNQCQVGVFMGASHLVLELTNQAGYNHTYSHINFPLQMTSCLSKQMVHI